MLSRIQFGLTIGFHYIFVPLTLGLIPLLTYIATWSGWLITRTGYYRDYAQNHGVKIPVISALTSHRRLAAPSSSAAFDGARAWPL